MQSWHVFVFERYALLGTLILQGNRISNGQVTFMLCAHSNI